jgi:ferredoxin
MTWVISRLCRDCLDMTCLDVCPVNCIVQPAEGPSERWPNQLYIVPSECIDCGACEPECPWEAITEDIAVPEAFAEDIALNAAVEEHRAAFVVPDRASDPRRPSGDEVTQNWQRWGASRN